MNIKRFDCLYEIYMGEHVDGEWVSHTDHIAALEAVKDDAEHERLMRASAIPTPYPRAGKSNLEAVKAELDRQHTLHDNLKRKYEGVCAKLELAEERVEAVKVKPLEWEYVERATMTYTASDACDVLYYIDQSFGSDSYYFTTIRWPEDTIYDGDDLPSAKAAAQADYDARILSALVTEVPSGPVKPLEPLEWHGWKSRSKFGDLYSIERLSEIVIQTHKNGTAFPGWKATHAEAVAVAQADYERVATLVPSPALEANQQVIETLRAALEDVRGTIKNARGAVESGQGVDKDVRGTLSRAIRKIDAALTPPTQDEEAGK